MDAVRSVCEAITGLVPLVEEPSVSVLPYTGQGQGGDGRAAKVGDVECKGTQGNVEQGHDGPAMDALGGGADGAAARDGCSIGAAEQRDEEGEGEGEEKEEEEDAKARQVLLVPVEGEGENAMFSGRGGPVWILVAPSAEQVAPFCFVCRRLTYVRGWCVQALHLLERCPGGGATPVAARAMHQEFLWRPLHTQQSPTQLTLGAA